MEKRLSHAPALPVGRRPGNHIVSNTSLATHGHADPESHPSDPADDSPQAG